MISGTDDKPRPPGTVAVRDGIFIRYDGRVWSEFWGWLPLKAVYPGDVTDAAEAVSRSLRRT